MRILTLALGVLIVSVLPVRGGEPTRTATAKHGMVVCVSPEAADVGVEVLKKGGNAVDAAVAVGFAMAVTYPAAGNIGGGGFMLVHPAAGDPTFFDYRETAPASVTDTFTKRQPGSITRRPGRREDSPRAGARTTRSSANSVERTWYAAVRPPRASSSTGRW